MKKEIEIRVTFFQPGENAPIDAYNVTAIVNYEGDRQMAIDDAVQSAKERFLEEYYEMEIEILSETIDE